MHLNDIGPPQVIVSYDVSSQNVFLTEACSSSTNRRLSELTIFSCPSDLLMFFIAMQFINRLSNDDYVTTYVLLFRNPFFYSAV